MTRPTARVAVLLGLLMAAALIIRFDALRDDAPDLPAFGDGHNYQVLAKDLADGKGFIRPVEYERQGSVIRTAEYPPALPVLLAAADLVGIHGVTGHRALLCLVGALTVGLVGLVGLRLGGEAVALLSAALAAIHPALVNSDVSLAAEPLASCLGAGVLLAALAVWDRPTVRRWAVLGGVLGVGCMVRAEFLLLVPILLVVLAVHGAPGWRDRARLAGAGLLAVVVVLAPWTIRNAVTFHRFVPVSNNLGSVLRGANCDLAYHGPFKGLWVTNVGTGSASTVDPGGACFSGFVTGPGHDEAQAAADLRHDGLSYAAHHAADLPGVVAARLGRTVGLYRFTQQANFARAEGRDAARERDGTRAFQLFAVVGLGGLALGGWRHRERLLPVALVAAVLVTVVVTYGNPRFRATAEPAVVLLAGLAAVDATRWVATRRVRPA